MSVDERSRFRHEARTFLNHIIGYAELLAVQAESCQDRLLSTALTQMRAAAVGLREPVQEYLLALTADSDKQAPADVLEELKKRIYSYIYDVISLTQTSRRLAVAAVENDIQSDVQKVHEASNSLVDLFSDFSEESSYDKTTGESIPNAPRTAFVDTAKAKRAGRILIVDDNEFNRDLLARHLERQGHVVCVAGDGHEAFGILEKAPFDIVLLDVMMPGMNGFQFLEVLKADSKLRDLSVIVISALEDSASIAHCIEMGAEDYLLREFDPIILRARIDNLLEKKEYKRQTDLVMHRLMDTQTKLAAELRDAATYVRSLLPKRLRWTHVAADWAFTPSLSLGGDCFYYHRIDETRLSLFLIDVSGHGIEAALLSVTIMNVLRNLSLGNADFGSPASVLNLLNRSFRIEDQNNMFFTIWYGVYDSSSRKLCYASGGAPPAIFIGPDGTTMELTGNGCIIGVDETAVYEENSVSIPPGSHMYLFSDGIFEVRKSDSAMLEWREFMDILLVHHNECALAPSCLSPINRIVEAVRAVTGQENFVDDVSIMEFAFNE